MMGALMMLVVLVFSIISMRPHIFLLVVCILEQSYLYALL